MSPVRSREFVRAVERTSPNIISSSGSFELVTLLAHASLYVEAT